MPNMSDDPGGRASASFADEREALATCEVALDWLRAYRDAHDGVFPERIFNALIRLRPSFSPEVIVHKVIGGEVFFWLTLRAVDKADPFNGLWHYTGTVERSGDYLIGGIQRVLMRELGGAALRSCQHVASIYPVGSLRSEILSLLYLCTLQSEPTSAEEGRWFSASEAMHLVPMQSGGAGILPSHQVGLALCLRALSRDHACPYLEFMDSEAHIRTSAGFSQRVLLAGAIDADCVRRGL